MLSSKSIEKIILDNFIEYQYLFVESQSNFLSGLHDRYQSVENGNLVLYFAKQTHQAILRQKDYDLKFNLSYDKFWENHRQIRPNQESIIKIARDTLLPKETTRRKILQLVKQKVLNKKNRNIEWQPNDEYKKSYNLAIDKEVDDLSRLINFICRKINLSISKETIKKELKEKFSFYWFHYLGVQLEYLRLWSKQLKDIELALISMQVVHLFTAKAKKKNLSFKDIFDNPSLIKEYISASISPTSVAEVTGIPRATCVRKLQTLVKMKIILQDKTSKRYYIIPSAIGDDVFSQNLIEKITNLFSDFYFICIRAIIVKISNQ